MPAMEAAIERRMKRWQDQRWLLDVVIQTVGIEWDQRRIGYTLGPCGPEATPDFTGVRARTKRFNDASREFRRAAARRENKARQHEAEGHLVAAGESYFIASLLYGSAQWPIFAHTLENERLGDKKVECYTKYTQYANHEIRRVDIPFGDSAIPAWLHLPNLPFNRAATNGNRGQLPCVMSIPGMDSFKETGVALYGDRMLERGVAVLSIDGPVQKEALQRGIHVTATNWMDAGRAVLDWMRAQPEIDPDRIAIKGTSMGSFWGTQVASIDNRIKGCAVQAVCHEPGMNTIFNVASPTFKLRFMYMAGYEDEDEFDRFAETMTLEGTGRNVTCPYLVLAGEDDHLSPIECTYDLMDTIAGPKQLVLYEGADHGLGGSSSSDLGPNPQTYIADWLLDRLNGKPMESQHILIDMAGQTQASGFSDYARAI
ncbi:MAG: alpha/beta hydrolase [Chloroflexota bacterium]|nr:alpha/beta hydrolase [Chloroflexota bacterium]